MLSAAPSTPARLLLAIAVSALLCACGTSPGPSLALPRSPAALPSSSHSHVLVMVLENEELSDVVASPAVRYLNGLTRRYALATDYYGVTHPSLPNYLALTGGSTFHISSDCTDCSVDARNLVDQLEAAHVSWKAYMEGLPAPGDGTAGRGGYAKKHDPFLYYRDVADDPSRRAKVVPYVELADDLRAGRLPTFAWITPNLCDDGHDCGLGSVDRYLAGVIPALIRELGPHGMLLLTWDEGTSDAGCCAGQASGGRVATLAIGPDALPGGRSALPYDHYSLLRTVEDALGLAPLGQAAAPATLPLDALFAHTPRLR